MEQLTQLIYVSSTKKLLCEEELNDMLTQARKANKKHHINGLITLPRWQLYAGY